MQVDYESGEKVYLPIARAIRDRVIARMPTEEERDRLSTGDITPMLIVTRADGSVEPYNAAVTVMAAEN